MCVGCGRPAHDVYIPDRHIGAVFLLKSENHDLARALLISVHGCLVVPRGLLRRPGWLGMRHRRCGNHTKYRATFAGRSSTSHGLHAAHTQEEMVAQPWTYGASGWHEYPKMIPPPTVISSGPIPDCLADTRSGPTRRGGHGRCASEREMSCSVQYGCHNVCDVFPTVRAAAGAPWTPQGAHVH